MEKSLLLLKQEISKLHLSANKSLGQHFLKSHHIAGEITSFGDLAGENILEIGPGTGMLTIAMVEAGAKHVIAIEKDDRAIPWLNDMEGRLEGKLSVLNADALTCDMSTFFSGEEYKIVANLPYNISVRLITKWLDESLSERARITQMVLMVQKEVANRICAKPGNKSYGALSVFCQLRADIRMGFNLPPQHFSPPPKVDSTVISITPVHGRYTNDILAKTERITKLAFQTRRKILKNNLKHLDGCSDVEQEVLHRRAEELSPEEFVKLAQQLQV